MEMNVYLHLQNTDAYLGMEALEHGRLYLVQCRNSLVGIWDAEKKAFQIRREKFGDVYLFHEFHWDTGESYGTAKPFLRLDELVGDQDRLTLLTRVRAELGIDDAGGLDRVLARMYDAEQRLRAARETGAGPANQVL